MEEADLQLCLDIGHHVGKYNCISYTVVIDILLRDVSILQAAGSSQSEAPMTPIASPNQHEEPQTTNEEPCLDATDGTDQRRTPIIAETADGNESDTNDNFQLMPPPPKRVKSEAEVDLDCPTSDEVARENAERFLEQLLMPAPLPSSSPQSPFVTPPARARPLSSGSVGVEIPTTLLEDYHGWRPLSAGRRRRNRRAEFKIYEDPKPGNLNSSPEGLATTRHSSSSSSDDEKENMVERDANEEGEEQTTRDNATHPAAEIRVRTSPSSSSGSPLPFDYRTAFPLRELRVPGPLDFFGNSPNQQRDPHQQSPRNLLHRDDDDQEVFERDGSEEQEQEQEQERPNRLFSARQPGTDLGDNNGGGLAVARNAVEGPQPHANNSSSPPPLHSAGGGGLVRPAVSLPQLNNADGRAGDDENNDHDTTGADTSTQSIRTHGRNANSNGTRGGYRRRGHSGYGYRGYLSDSHDDNDHRGSNRNSYPYRGRSRGYRSRYTYGRGSPVQSHPR